jgi:hypothetical protein
VSLVISSLMKLRETTLLKGVQDLLNDQDFSGIARDLYNHALVNPLASGTARVIEDLTHKPAYIDSRQFALAIYGKLSENAWSPKGESPADVIAKIPDAKLKTAMESLWANSSQDVDAFKHNIAVWFDNAMDSVSGSYKRRIQWVSFLVALGIAVIFNVNVLYEAAQIWTRQSVIADAETTHFQADTAAADASKVLNALEPAFLIGWVKGPMPYDLQSLLIALSSWIIVASASLFGASFWFDILQRITHLKGTGPDPKRSDKPRQPDG